MKASDLVAGLPGHPTHPPLTDAVIGLCSGAGAFAVLSAVGVSEENTAVAWWLALVAGLVVTAPTPTTGLLDWLKLSRHGMRVLDEVDQPARLASAPTAPMTRERSAVDLRATEKRYE